MSDIRILIDGYAVADFSFDCHIPARQIKDESFRYHGELDGYPCCSFVSTSDVMMIGAGCHLFTVQEGLDHWRNKDDREQIFALCEKLAELAKQIGAEISYPETLAIKSSDIRQIIHKIREDGLAEDEDDLVEALEELLESPPIDGIRDDQQQPVANDGDGKKKKKK